ncbi:glycosyltransferase [Orbaceae bacterium ESL0721]|nr:glycosyltransferase [Orbaceae bacterium ESL0721]
MSILHPAIDKITHLTLSVNSKNTKHIALTFDDNYAMPAGITIYSIIQNNPNLNFHFHLIISNISEENIDKFTTLVNKNISISFYNINTNFKINNDTLIERLPPISCARFIIPLLVNNLTDKVLYIDSDIICAGSLEALFNENLNHHIAAAVVDSIEDMHTYAKEKLKFNQNVYFNSGLLLINIPEWERNNLTSKCIEMVNNGSIYKFADQDVLNLLLKDKIKLINKKYNYEIILSVNGKEEKTIKPDDVFIHYVSSNKPWYQVYNSLIFKKYLLNSPWKHNRLPLSNKNSSLRQYAHRCLKMGNITKGLYFYYLYLKHKK